MRLGAAEPPLLRDLAIELSRKLYPEEAVGGGVSGSSAAIASGTIPIERLAQEYEIAFGRTDLHELLRNQVRNDDISPSEVHTQLLRLPWRDVFTTNWDTLLERGRVQVSERAYSVVTNMDEIPLGRQPRIVKLHGSLPAQFPLIFTEEDYRTYPEKFAPFVNTVQQAMMETIFCLIGFSGDDPNFLHWSGWVRDNLGTSAPRIYLMGWLDLSPHRRRMLEARGVVPIDVAHHPNARNWPEQRHHRYAIDWVLHTLERGRPYDETYWPAPVTHQVVEIPHDLQPVAEVAPALPEEEPEGGSTRPGDPLEQVKTVLEIWEHNRQLYPGWLLLPEGEQRQGVQRRTDHWETELLRVLEELDPPDRLRAIREVVWRREILLEPISASIESAGEDALASVEYEKRTDGRMEVQVDKGDIREAWWAVALALLTAARFRFDRDLFEQRLDALTPFADQDSDAHHRIQHELCLWAASWLEFETLDGLLEDWWVEGCDPVWMLRKAALLWERDRGPEGATLVRSALAEIRQRYSPEPTPAGASREGWALWSEFDFDNRRTVWKRWHELARWKGDAASERSSIQDAIREGAPAPEAPSFEPGVQKVTLHFSNVDVERAAHRAVRLAEVAGLPPVTRHDQSAAMEIAAPLLKSAAEQLAASQPELAIRLVLRACSSETDKTLDRVVSRVRIAVLPDSSVAALASTCIDAIQQVLPKLASIDPTRRRIHGIPRISVAMEVLSRLAIRMEPEQVEVVLDLSLGYYRSPLLLRELTLRRAAAALLKRSWEALPGDRRSDRVLDILDTPILGLGDLSDLGTELFDDPGKVIRPDDIPGARTPRNEHLWRNVTSSLVRGLSAGGEARALALGRLLPLVISGVLTREEEETIAKALWSDALARDDGLPAMPSDLYDFVLLLLPEPSEGLAEERFRQKWLAAGSARGETSASAFEILDEVGIAISQLRIRGRSLQLLREEQEVLVYAVRAWAETPVPDSRPAFLLPFGSRREGRALTGLVVLVSVVPIPSGIGEAVYRRAREMASLGMGGFELASALARVLPARVAEIATWLRAGVVSGDPSVARSAMRGLHSWLKTSLDEEPQSPRLPQDLIREVGLVIASRRGVALPQALYSAAWIFDNGTAEARTTLEQLVLQGLAYLEEELQYEPHRAPDGDIDVPWLRSLCARLAQSMADRGLAHEPAVASWLELARRDPLPEVRRAVTFESDE